MMLHEYPLLFIYFPKEFISKSGKRKEKFEDKAAEYNLRAQSSVNI